jgi:hypothetical protein
MPSRSCADKGSWRFPDKMRRASGASPIRDLRERGTPEGPGSAAHHFMLRCARETSKKQESGTPTNAVQQPPRLTARHRPHPYPPPRFTPSLARRGPHFAGEGMGGGGSPVGVPPRHLRQRPNATAQLQPRDFRGLGRRARPDGSKDARVATFSARTVRTAHVTAGVTRAFLSPSSEIAPAVRS